MIGRSPHRTVRSHCPYCSLNCGLELEHDGRGDVIGQRRWKGAPLSRGAVCSKGATAWETVRNPERLRHPMVRIDGELVETTWAEALDRAAQGFIDLRRRHGADVNAVLSSGSLTNEKAYLVGKFARLALRTRHLDDSGRLCIAAARTAYLHAFGVDRAMTPLEDLHRADVIVVVGANLSETYPVMIPDAIAKARRRGAEVIVVDPRFGHWVHNGDLKLGIRPGTDAALFLGLLAEVDREKLIDWDFVARRTTGIEEALAEARAWTPEAVEATTGVDADLVRIAARAIGSAKRCMILHARGADQQVAGTDNVSAMINLALACGHVGTPGSGIIALTGQRNGQGIRDWGQSGDHLPGSRPVTDPFQRAVVARRWGVDAGQLPPAGASYVEILELAGEGKVKGLLSIADDVCVAAPDQARVAEQLARLEHVVVIDPFLTELAARHADVVLPGTTFAEEEGTVTTLEGRVVRCDQAAPPVADYSDIDIIRNLARRLGVRQHFDFVRGKEVWEEMRRVSIGTTSDCFGITWDRARDGVFQPCPTEEHPGTPRLHLDRFATPDGRANFRAVTHRVRVDEVDPELPLVLTTGRHPAQFLSGTQTKRIPAQNRQAPGPYVEIHPDTAAELELLGEERVVLTTRQGRAVVPWKPNPDLRPDTVFMPYHWRDANLLTSAELDPTSKVPGFKYTPVAVSPLLSEEGASAVATPVDLHPRAVA